MCKYNAKEEIVKPETIIKGKLSIDRPFVEGSFIYDDGVDGVNGVDGVDVDGVFKAGPLRQ